MDVGSIVRQEEVVFGDREKRVYGNRRVEYDGIGRVAKIMLGTGYLSLAVGSAVIGGVCGINHETVSIREGLEQCFQSYPALVGGVVGAATLGVCFGRAAFEGQSRNYLTKSGKISIATVIGMAAGSLIGTGMGGATTSAGYLIGRAVGAL